MAIVRIPQVGATGVNKDLAAPTLPANAWTDVNNVRFLDGNAQQSYGYGQVYGTPSATPQYVMPCNITGARYWIYATAAKTYATTITAGSVVETDITHATPRTGVVNNWTGGLLSGLPILNTGDTSSVPMYFDLNLTHKFVDLPNWIAGMYCKSLRPYKNYLVALGVTKAGTYYPNSVLWSHPADPGSVPSSYDVTDATKDAGWIDLPGNDVVIDGMQLRSSFMIYKENSIHRMDFTGGAYVMSFTQVIGTSGALNRNCIVELDGLHLVLTGDDVILHDGQTAVSCLDKETRRYLFQNIDVTNSNLAFVFKNPFFNEVYICYPSIGSSVCNKALVWNQNAKTCSFQDMPNLNHAAFGAVDNSLAGNWNQDSAPWASDLTSWNGPDYVPSTARVIMASSGTKLYMLDSSAAFDGVIPASYMERRGLTFDDPEHIKLVKGIRPRIDGNTGDTILIYVGSSNDPYLDPTYGAAMTHTIGTTISNDCLISGRYIAVKFATGTAYQWRLASYDMDVEQMGLW